VEGGAIEIIESPVPVLIAAQKGLNEPRYASLPNIMKAKKKEIKVLKASDVGVSDSDLHIRMKDFRLPPARQAVQMIDGDANLQAEKLVKLLREQAKVI
jgi:electron transfer flavoprotein beta subunit